MAALSMSSASLQSRTHLANTTGLTRARVVAAPMRQGLMVKAGNSNDKGIFAPIVRKMGEVIGKKTFNQIRGKGIGLHSQVIGEFCKEVGADPKTRQRLILMAKKTGGELGFLA